MRCSGRTLRKEGGFGIHIGRRPQPFLADHPHLSPRLTALMYCGAYQYPPPTLTGSVRGDIMHVEQCVGLGELAVSDMRASAPTRDELARVASGTYHGCMLFISSVLSPWHSPSASLAM